MAYLKIECSVARNRKFIKAGPGPSWLWVCGLAYCQEGLTDGFIPDEAIGHLGVKENIALRMVTHLESAGLWDRVDGGWRVHDYLRHNKSASEVAAIKASRAEGGKQGGRPKKNLHQTSKVSGMETFAVVASVDDAVAASVEGVQGEIDLPPMDVWARELVNLYDSRGRCKWNLVERPLYDALANIGGDPWQAWALLKARLEQHKGSHRWRVKGMVPRLDRWLRDGTYLQELPEGQASEQMTKATNITGQAMAEILNGRAS